MASLSLVNGDLFFCVLKNMLQHNCSLLLLLLLKPSGSVNSCHSHHVISSILQKKMQLVDYANGSFY